MRGFRNLVKLGVLLVSLILIIDTIDAGRKQEKKKELETSKSYDEDNSKFTSKNKQTESIKRDKVKNNGPQRTGNFEEEDQHVSKGLRFESKKPEINKNNNFASKEKKYTENEKAKISKQLKKSKNSKVLEEEPAEKFDSSKLKVKKTKPHYRKSENVDKIIKTVKKTTQKKLVEENKNVEKILNEELNRLKNEETISEEETIGGNPKKKKYKLVQVVLQEDGEEEEQEGNEIEPGTEEGEFVNVENEEITENTRSIHNPKFYKNKKSSKKQNPFEEEENYECAIEEDYFKNTEETAEPEFSEESSSEFDSYDARYRDPAAGSCPRLPEDPKRKGPKKLTLYVLEEKINGQVMKRVVPEEDGVTMCEVAELLKQTYGMANP